MKKQSLIHLFFISLLASMFHCATLVEIPVVQNMPPRLTEVMKGKRNIGIVTVENKNVKGDYDFDWAKVVQGSITDTLVEYGYFNIVDISSRKARLSEIAYSQSGVTDNMLSVGREMQIDALLFIDMLQAPKDECRIEKRISKAGIAVTAAAAAVVLYRMSEGKSAPRMDPPNLSQPTGVRNLTVFVRGRLVNVEDGTVLSFTNNVPFAKEASPGDPGCPSMLETFSGATELAAENIAKNISPRASVVNVPLEKKDSRLSGRVKREVGSYLEKGVEWATGKPPNFDRAAASWERALEVSDYSSASAYWNLAISRWSNMDIDGAQDYFNRAEELGGADFLDEEKMNVVSRFSLEKKRIEKERR